MSENSSQDKSEQPTEHRLRKAREEGQIARSRELQSAVLVLMAGALLVMSSRLGEFSAQLMQQHYDLDRRATTEPGMMLQYLGSAMELVLSAFLPILATLWLAGFISGMIPGGWLITSKAAQPRFNRLNPLSGLKRMFSSQSLVELVKSVLKVTLLCGIMIWMIWSHADAIIKMNQLPLSVALAQGLDLLAGGAIALGAGLAVIALLDVPYQRWHTLKQLRMTKQEVKDEHKNTEGRPEIKRRVRELQYQMSRQRIDRRVPDADVVITNPTHYAVAVRYAPELAEAPYVIAKGTDRLAQRIREVASQHDKPLVEIPELARALYYSTRVDQEIPAGLYNAVAHVLMYVVQLNAYKAGRSERPTPPRNLQIPESLRR